MPAPLFLPFLFSPAEFHTLTLQSRNTGLRHTHTRTHTSSHKHTKTREDRQITAENRLNHFTQRQTHVRTMSQQRGSQSVRDKRRRGGSHHRSSSLSTPYRSLWTFSPTRAPTAGSRTRPRVTLTVRQTLDTLDKLSDRSNRMNEKSPKVKCQHSP